MNGALRADHPCGEHAARICARVVAIGLVSTRRHDAEGSGEIDLEAQSQKMWRTWLLGLTDEQRSQIRIWRGGAVRTPTRRWSLRGAVADPSQKCSRCSCERASARHLWAECRRFDV